MQFESHVLDPQEPRLEQNTLLSAAFGDGATAFTHRCYMLDISRDRVPTMDTLRWLVDVLATLRFTELQLYTEHTYTFTGHDEVWAAASALTREDLAELTAWASQCGLILTANLNTFGHMERWLQHDSYRHRAECPDGLSPPLDAVLAGPTCLAPNDDNATFAVGLARELADALGSRQIMIGGDEPFELGTGVSAQEVARVGRDQVYRTHLERIIHPLVDDGYKVLFWGDQFRTDPHAFVNIPENAKCVIWNYEAPSSATTLADELPIFVRDLLGWPDDAALGFAAHARIALASHVPTWVACGTSSWNTFLGRNRNAAANIDDAAAVGAAGGADGFMLTDWGDNGHWQPLAVSLPSMVRGAIGGLTGAPVDPSFRVGPVIDSILDAPDGTGALIDELGEITESIGATAYNGSAAFNAVIPIGLSTGGSLDQRAADDALSLLDRATAWFAPHRNDDSRWGIAAQELDAACRATALGLHRLLGTSESPDDVDRAVEAQRAAWLRSSRPGGLDDSIARLRR